MKRQSEETHTHDKRKRKNNHNIADILDSSSVDNAVNIYNINQNDIYVETENKTVVHHNIINAKLAEIDFDFITSNQTNNNDGIHLVSVMGNTDVMVNELAIKTQLRELSSSGHSLAINTHRTYCVPLFLDIDCSNCKNNNCRSLLSVQTKLDTSEKLADRCRQLFPFLKTTTHTCFAREKSCGFHLYFNTQVSVFLLDYINQSLICDNLCVVFLDEDGLYVDQVVKGIPLYFNTKVHKDPYFNLTKNNTISYDIFLKNQEYFDFKMKMSKTTTSDDVPLFKVNINKPDSEWLPMVNSTVDVYSREIIKPEYILQTRTELVDYLTTNNLVVTTTNSKFEEIIKYNRSSTTTSVKVDRCLKNIISRGDLLLTQFSEINLPTEEEKLTLSLLESFKTFGGIIANKLMIKSTFCPFSVFAYLFYNNTDNIDFSFYYLYCMANLLYLNLEQYTIREGHFTDIFFKLILSTYTNINSITYKMLIDLIKYNAHEDIFLVFRDHYIKILEYICYWSLHYEEYDGTFNFDALKFQNKIVNDNSFKLVYTTEKEDVLDIIKNMVPFIIMEGYDDNTLYLYNGATYSAIKRKDFYNTPKYICFVSKICDILKTTTESISITEAKDMVRTAFELYYDECKITRKGVFGEYKYFILVKHVVFNTLTGTYMTPIPYLFFEKNKHKNIGPCESIVEQFLNTKINLNLHKHFTEWGVLLNNFYDKQELLFIYAVYIPGFCTLHRYFNNENFRLSKFHKLIHITLRLSKKTKQTLLSFFQDHFNVNNIDLLGEVVYAHKQNTYGLNSVMLDINLIVTNKNKLEKNLLAYIYCVYFQLSSFSCKIKNEMKQKLSTSYSLTTIDCNCLQNNEFFCAKNTKYYNPDINIYEKATLKTMHINRGHKYFDIFETLSITFAFELSRIKDFLNYMCLYFQPQNTNRKFLVCVGVTRSGKSRISIMLKKINTPSAHSEQFAVSASVGGKPQNNTVDMYSSYLVQIMETKELSSDLIKSITGQDAANIRKIYAENKTQSPICFIVCYSNSIPKMVMPDRAIESRIMFIKFEVQIRDNASILPHESNYLTLFLNNSARQPDHNFDQEVVTLNNLLYVAFKQNMKTKECTPKIEAPIHEKLILDFMCKNNIVRNILRERGYVCNKNECVNALEFKKIIEEELTNIKYNKLTYFKFNEILINTCDVIFVESNIIGLGKEQTQKHRRLTFKLEHRVGEKVYETELIGLLVQDNFIINDAYAYSKRLKTTYTFDDDVGAFIDTIVIKN